MADKKDPKHDYERGYHDGREGKPYKSPSVAEIVVGALMPGVDPVGDRKDYSEGYRDGKEDRKR